MPYRRMLVRSNIAHRWFRFGSICVHHFIGIFMHIIRLYRSSTCRHIASVRDDCCLLAFTHFGYPLRCGSSSMRRGDIWFMLFVLLFKIIHCRFGFRLSMCTGFHYQPIYRILSTFSITH
uniref:Uncharacterized protein n=1 Tax=Parascaris univalens TaxID=6257 RepID=A0A915B529_PARUN